MKKFLFLILLLVIFGGAGFFFGWAQLNVPAGSYGVMRSKTHGVESNIIREGQFRWFWYKLIPTNVKISVFTLETVKYPFRSSGSLNSGQIYTALAGLNADFSWEISGDLSFSLKPEALPFLAVKENLLNNESLRKFEEILAARIGNFVIQHLNGMANNDNGNNMESIALLGSSSELNNAILSAFPEIENLNCTLSMVRIPDYALYQSVKALYSEFISLQNSTLRTDTLIEAEKRINTRIRMDELSQYGEILTKYPILIQYLALEKGLLPINE